MSRTLLLADGSVTIQRVMELTFAHEDIRVTAVSDGRKAMQMLETDRPDVVLADVDLPEVNGYAIAAHMRKSARLKNVPVLLLAGAFEPVDQQKAREVGSDGVIVKPFEPQVVVTRVRELIEQRDRASAPAAPKAEAAPPPVQESPRPPRPEPAFSRPAQAEAPETPETAPEMAAAPPSPPEPLELPTRPIWDVRGSVAQGPPPIPPMPFPPSAAVPHAAPAPPVAAPLPSPPPQPAPKVTLANAFTALLAAEQTVHPAPAASAPAAVSEASIEEAVRRVLVRMTDDLVRRIVVDTAERLIREEIERIKSNTD